jgi:hypothetical protein
MTHNTDKMTPIKQQQVLCSPYSFNCMLPAVPHHEIVHTVASFRHNIEFCTSITRQFFGTLTMKSVKNVPIHYATPICRSDHNVRTSELVRRRS